MGVSEQVTDASAQLFVRETEIYRYIEGVKYIDKAIWMDNEDKMRAGEFMKLNRFQIVFRDGIRFIKTLRFEFISVLTFWNL